MNFLTLLALVLGLWLMLAVLMTLAWWIEQRSGNSGWVDVVWTSAMGLTGIVGATAAYSFGDLSNRQLLIVALVLVWAMRLAGHIARRTTTVSDDPRYAKLRLQWGTEACRNMFWLLQAQAALSVPMAVAIVLGAWNPAPLFTATDWIAAILFCVGFAGSGLADVQLARFKQSSSSSGRVCNTGLWSWSRHPNYFFEWLIWVAFALFAINLAGDWTWGYVALIGPTCMYWLLRFASGVPPLEEHMLAKYGAAYAGYQQSTSVFFPLPPNNPSR
ncbi:MAG: steroid 5-alpha reductase family enzyme [Hyphomicrobiaceae bacterium]|jgi:steroid 5-alpha reductase family enzyme